MYTYQIVTQCGVFVRIDAVNTYQAATQARDEGWVVVAVIRLNKEIIVTTNNNLATIQLYIDNNYLTDDSLSIAQRVYKYMLKESIEVTNDNIATTIQDVYFK